MKTFAIPMGALSSDDDETPSRPLMEAQRMELLSRWQSYNEPQNLKPGDLVVEKDGLGRKKPSSRGTILMMVWRMLDPHSPYDAALIEQWLAEYPSNRLDCLVAWLTDDAVAVIFEPHELAQLRRWEPTA